MDNETLFNQVMQKVCKTEFSAFEYVPKHSFSRDFDRKIERLEREEPARKAIPFRRRRTFILIAVIAAVISVCGFATFKILFVADSPREGWLMLTSMARNAPEKIQHYYLPVLPESFYPDESCPTSCSDEFYNVGFTDGFNHIYFTQTTASHYKAIFDKGAVSLVNNITEDTIDVHFKDCFIVARIWSDGEYIYEICGSLEFFEGTEFKNLYEVYPEVSYEYQ